MRPVSGPISDRLRRLFGDKVADWPAYRQPEAKPMPKSGVGGKALGGKPGRKAAR